MDSGECGVCIDGSYDGDAAEFSDERIVRARKPHQCCECGDTIPVGAEYERAVGKWDGRMFTYHTCLACRDVRRNLCCDGWTYTLLWEDAHNSGMFERLTTGCLEQLGTAAGKAKLLSEWRKWKGLDAGSV